MVRVNPECASESILEYLGVYVDSCFLVECRRAQLGLEDAEQLVDLVLDLLELQGVHRGQLELANDVEVVDAELDVEHEVPEGHG